MKLTAKLTAVISAFVLTLSAAAISSQAQTEKSVRPAGKGRVIVVRRAYYRNPYWYGDPFWYGRHRFGFGYYDPFYDPYYLDPYLNYRREKYYKEKSVRDARRKLLEDEQKFRSDGQLTEKEGQKLAERREKYRKAVEKLNRFNREN